MTRLASYSNHRSPWSAPLSHRLPLNKRTCPVPAMYDLVIVRPNGFPRKSLLTFNNHAKREAFIRDHAAHCPPDDNPIYVRTYLSRRRWKILRRRDWGDDL